MQAKSFFSNLIREPLLHFTVIGLAIFLLFPGNAGPMPGPVTGPMTDNVIEVTPRIKEGLAAQFTATWNRQPTPVELDGLMAEYVKEEVLYREALALGLDQGDPVIRQRLRLKMEFIGEGAAGALTPDDAELAAWYAENAADYAAPAMISFEQIMLTDPSTADATFAALAEGADPGTLGRGTLLPAEVGNGSALAIDGAFGTGFFDAVSVLEPGVWGGPVESAYGVHIVRLGDVTVAEAPLLDTVRDALIEDWRRAQAELLREAQFQSFLTRYEVRLPEDAVPCKLCLPL